jgi:mannose-6-phosphate isomerase-like protein (cupin superfamily)
MASNTNAARIDRKPVEPTAHDLKLLETAMGEAESAPGAEQFRIDGDSYLDDVIAKPWGFEYRVYADTFYDVWKLRLRPGHGTSTHCHPRKDTALLVLAGTGSTHFLGQEQRIRPLDLVHIRRGVFHSTENTGDGMLDLVEIELPRNKLDLVRSGDRYGRAGLRYETETLDWAATEMVAAELVAHSRLRRRSLTGEYAFDVQRGAAVTLGDETLFAVSLSLQHAVVNEIHVFAPALAETLPEPECAYLTISQRI